MPEGGRICRYRFGDFVVDERRSALQQNGEDLPLRPKSWEVLRELVIHAGELVTKERLLEAVWPDRVVTEGVVAKSVREIRQVLGDEDRSVVRLVPRRGYRFEGLVTVEVIDDEVRGESAESPSPPNADPPVDATATVEAAASPPEPGARPDPVPRPRVARLWRLAAMAAVLLVAIAVVWTVAVRAVDSSQRRADGGRLVPAERSIAVLPFDDMSPGGDQQFLADGIAEEILNFLSMSRELTVIARTSSFALRGESVDAVTVGRRLNVAYVLEGSLRRSGDMLRVAVQLVDGRDGSRVWAESYDRQLGDSLELQAEIARAVSENLHVRLANSGQRRPLDPVAYQRYAEARFRFNRRFGDDLLRAEELFLEATRIDPDFARAWAGLAGVYWVRTGIQYDDPIRLSMPEAIEAMALPIERALQADPDLAEAHVRASNFYRATGQADRARVHLARAQVLAPSDPLVLATFGWDLEDPLSPEREIELSRKIIKVDPLSLTWRYNLIWHLIEHRRMSEARRELGEAMDLFPSEMGELGNLAAMLELLEGNFDAAAAAAESISDASDSTYERSALLAMAWDAQGVADRAAEVRTRLEAASDEWAALRLAEIHAYAGAGQEAFAWLHEAWERAGPDAFVRIRFWNAMDDSPFLVELKDDARWRELRQQYEQAASITHSG